MKKKKKRKKPIPKVKWCKNCGEHRVKYHHYYCEKCWKELHFPEEKEKEVVIKF
jgi:predicted amidophosphoribosyltransferase